MSRKTTGFGDFGVKLDAAMQDADAQVPKSTAMSAMRLCGIRMDNINSHLITAPAFEKRQQGILIVGPRMDQRKDVRSLFALTVASTAVRWVLDPVHVVHNKVTRKKHRTKPSISPTYMARLSCPNDGEGGRAKCKGGSIDEQTGEWCSHTEDMYWDNLFRKYANQRKELRVTNAQFVAYGARDKGQKQRGGRGAPPILCDVCASIPLKPGDKPGDNEVLMNQQRIYTTLLPAGLGRRAVDPLFTGLDDPALVDMETAWNAELPPGPDATFLPRIWAVYFRGNAATDLPPHDAKGLDIDRRLADDTTLSGGKTYTIRPARVAWQVPNPQPRNFIIEANPQLTWGWVSEVDLLGRRDMGYTRWFLRQEKAKLNHSREAGCK